MNMQNHRKNKLLLVFILVLILSFLSGCTSPLEGVEDSEKYKLTILALDWDTEEPISAVVHLSYYGGQEGPGERVFSGYTNLVSGKLTIEDIDIGTYVIFIGRGGFVSKVISLTDSIHHKKITAWLEDGQPETAQARWNIEPVDENQTYAVSFKVTDKAEMPINDALVLFGDKSCHTDNEGKVSFEYPEGTYTFQVDFTPVGDPEGAILYSPISGTVTLDRDKTIIVTLAQQDTEGSSSYLGGESSVEASETVYTNGFELFSFLAAMAAILIYCIWKKRRL